jgi:hypothetical protein
VISAGDLITCTGTTAASVAEGGVIAYFGPASSNSSVITHRSFDVVSADDDTPSLRTQVT